MNNRKSLIAALVAMMAMPLFGDVYDVNLKGLYSRLLAEQGTLGNNVRFMPFSEFQFESMFKNAEDTGLNAQYTEILTSPNKSKLIDAITNTAVLKEIAFLQNTFGGGNPFVYNGKPYDYNPVVGAYMAPGPNKVTITWYSFFNGLLDRLTVLSKDPVIKEDPYFKSVYEKFVAEMTKAIDDPQAVKFRAYERFNRLATKVKALIDKGDLQVINFVDNEIIPKLMLIVGD